MKQTLYTNSSLLDNAQHIIEQTRQESYCSVNISMILCNWLLGKRISEERLQGESRAEYGDEVIKRLPRELTAIHGKGFTKNNLYRFILFFKIFPPVLGQSELLSWSHYLWLLPITDEAVRNWYAHDAFTETWSVRILLRNIASQYYYRLLQSQNKEEVSEEMKTITASTQNDKLKFIKNPVVAEFFGLAPNISFTELQLEESIITHLQTFIMEMGKGYAFVARQQHIHTDMGDFYIDLVFYNNISKCFLLIDLKTTHQDVEQMDMYVRMYDELKRTEDDNPTIGLILCSQTSVDMVRYFILKENEQLFQAKYLTYLPTEEEIRNEIEHQKAIFMEQQMDKRTSN